MSRLRCPECGTYVHSDGETTFPMPYHSYPLTRAICGGSGREPITDGEWAAKIQVELNAARERVFALESAIRDHRGQKADDRCIEDDDRLYAALGDGIKCDRRVGCTEAMFQNCKRFITNRCEGGGWPSYVELEAEVSRLRERVRVLTGHAEPPAKPDCGRPGGVPLGVPPCEPR